MAGWLWGLPCHNADMSNRSAPNASVALDDSIRSERLPRLRFEDAMNDCIELSDLAMEMVERIYSREELIWIQNGFKPGTKNRRAKTRREARRS